MGRNPMTTKGTNMIRYFAIAHYTTAGGNHGSTSFHIVAANEEQATRKATWKASERGRSRVRVHVRAEV